MAEQVSGTGSRVYGAPKNLEITLTDMIVKYKELELESLQDAPQWRWRNSPKQLVRQPMANFTGICP